MRSARSVLTGCKGKRFPVFRKEIPEWMISSHWEILDRPSQVLEKYGVACSGKAMEKLSGWHPGCEEPIDPL